MARTKHVSDEQHKVVLTYPPATTGALEITSSDLKRLEPFQLLNDKLIDFGLQFWKREFEKSHPDLAQGVFTFNTFFLKKLKECGYDGVRRWTEKTDIFEKRCILIPCHDPNAIHWYLTIVYEPWHILGDTGAERQSLRSISYPATCFKDEDKHDFKREVFNELPQKFYFGVESDEVTEYLETIRGAVPDVEARFIDKRELLFLQTAPDDETELYDARTSTAGVDEGDDRTWIFCLDSMGHTHFETARLVKTFLYEEAKIKKGIPDPVEACEKMSSPLVQKNGTDCGLYLLHYANTFMTQPEKYAKVTRNQDKYEQQKLEKIWKSDGLRGSREKLKECIACLQRTGNFADTSVDT